MAKLLCLGDSIMWGVTGFDAAHPRANPTIPDKIGQLIGVEVDNQAISATSVNDGNNSLVQLLSSVNFADYDYVLIGYGANDWGLNKESLSALRSGLDLFATMLSASGAKPYVLIDLPVESFINNASSLDSPNAIGITQNQVCDVFKQFAIDNGYHYYDWRENPILTPQNYKSLTGDGCLHPNFDTQMKMAERLADYIKSTQDNTPSKPDDKPAQPNNPDTPSVPIPPDDKPVQPTIKLIDELKIDRLKDLFGIGTNVSNGTDKFIDKVNEIYKVLSTLVGTDTKTVQKELTSPGNELQRPLRDYVIKNFMQLESVLNDLIQTCNKNWIVDPQTGNETPTQNLERLSQLTLDSRYSDTLNNNWKTLEQTINQLISWINQTLKGE